MDDIQALKNLSDHDLTIFNAELDRKRRSVPITYLLWFFFGSLGVHKFYLGRIPTGVFYLALFGTGWFLAFGGFLLAGAAADDPEAGAAGVGMTMIGWVASALLGLFLLWDLFTIPRQMRKREERIRGALLSKLK